MNLIERHRRVVDALEFGITELEVLERYCAEMAKSAYYTSVRDMNDIQNPSVLQSDDGKIWENIQYTIIVQLASRRKMLRHNVFVHGSDKDGKGI